MKLLVVDDNRETRDFLRLALQAEDVEVHLAGSGADAIARVRDTGFDAILVDVQMPGLDGWDTVGVLRALDNGRHATILIFTAFGDLEARRRSVEAGADGILFKPLMPAQLLEEIQKHANRRPRNAA